MFFLVLIVCDIDVGSFGRTECPTGYTQANLTSPERSLEFACALGWAAQAKAKIQSTLTTRTMVQLPMYAMVFTIRSILIRFLFF
jgi:hypothetical protein